MTTRREVLASIGGIATASALGAPIRSLVGATNSMATVSPGQLDTPYVKKGLVALWDGKTLVAGEQWTDVVGGRVLNAPLSWSENGSLYTTNSAATVSLKMDLGKTYTIEVCKATDGMDWSERPVFKANNSNTRVTGVYYSYYNWWGYYNLANKVGVNYANNSWRGHRNFVASIDGSSAFFYCYANGIYKVKVTLSNPLPIDNITFFGEKNARYYCIRIYKRTLTESEIESNSKIDMERFGI